MPKNLSRYAYTLMQHTGYTEGQRSDFLHAVEEIAVDPEHLGAIHKAGGLIFQDYTDARDRAFQENYPPGRIGMIPKVTGKFRFIPRIGVIYIPERK